MCWDSESHYSSLGNELPFQRDTGKDGKMKATAIQRDVGVAVRDENKASWV